MFQNRRLRVLANSFIVLLTSILFIIYFNKTGPTSLSRSNKAALAGHSALFTASLLSLVVVGFANQTGIAVFNAFISFVYYVGALLILAYADIITSSIVVWWFLLASIIYVNCADLQSGGTIKVRRSIAAERKIRESEALQPADEN